MKQSLPIVLNAHVSKISLSKKSSVVLFLLLLLVSGNIIGQTRSFLGLNGGFEGAATIVNGSINSSPVITNWTKSTTSATIANETSIVRSGSNSMKVSSSSSTLCRIFSPSMSITSSTTAWQVQYYRRSISTTATIQNQLGNYRGGTEQTNSTYSTVTGTTTWEKVTYSPSATTAAITAAASITAKMATSAGDAYFDDFVLYESASVDVTAPNSPGAVTIYNQTPSSLDVSWGAASGGVDGGGYIVIRYDVSPNANNDPNQNGIYAVNNTHNNGTGNLTGTVRYIGTGTSFTDSVGLSLGTQYWYKVYTFDKAYNYSNETQGTGDTSIPLPSVVTYAATSISTTGATLNGNVTNDGGVSYVTAGFVYNTNSGITMSDNPWVVANSSGVFSLSLSSLLVNTQYYFRAHVTNAWPSPDSTVLGSELNFFTLANSPNTLLTNNPTSISLDVAIGSGDGNPSTTEYAIQETGSNNYLQANGTLGSSAVWKTAAIWGTKTVSGLSANTSYTFQVKSRNGANIETAFSGTTTLTTLPPTNNWIGVNGNWNTTTNWSLGTVPVSTDNITITNGSPIMDIDYTLAAGRTLTISGTGVLTINSGKTLTIAGTADFGGKSVTLKSDATGTGTIGQVIGTLVGASNVTVERYIPFGKRAYRLLTPSVTTTSTVYNNWQISGATTAGQGTHISGSTSGANGFDTTTSGNPSMFTYENNVASGTGWLAIPNTDVTTLTAGMGYRTLVRGDRNVDISVASTDNMNVATTLAATGTLKVGNVVFNSSSSPALNNTISTSSNTTTNDFSLIGNPYASPVNWSLVTKVNVGDTYYTWDPNMGTAAQRGRYVAYDITTGRDIPESAVSQYIQPGQAFFVKTTAASPVLTFKEADKATSFTNVFRTNEMNSRLSISVYNPTEVAFATPIDGTTAAFGTDFNASIGVGDVEKLFSAGESLAWSRGTKLLAIDALAPVVANDELHLKTMQFAANKSYTFKINATNFDNTVTAFLVDQYLNIQTQVDLTAPNFVTFATTADIASYGADRFKVVFSPSSALNNAEWNSKSLRIYPNPVVDNLFTIAVSPSITNKVMITIYNMIGQTVYKESATAINNAILVSPSALLKAGVYMVEMVNNGKTSTQKIIIK